MKKYKPLYRDFDKYCNERFNVYCDSNKFNIYQLNEIKDGIDHNLSQEILDTYAKPEYNWIKMSVIREAIYDKLDYKYLLNIDYEEKSDNKLLFQISNVLRDNKITQEEREQRINLLILEQ